MSVKHQASMDWGDYRPSRRLELAARALLSHRNGGAAAVLLSGPPGCGKTAFAEALARGLRAPLLYYLLHEWSDADELYVGVDVPAAVAGEAEAVRQPGVLLRAAQLAEAHDRVVVCLDELDKAPERAEYLLLDWLQSGRVPVRPGVQVTTDLSRVIVVVTTNETRPLSDALLRRLRRVVVDPLPPAMLAEIAEARTGGPRGLCRLIVRAALDIQAAEQTAVSVQEISHAVREIRDLAESVDDVREIIQAWLARGETGRETARALSYASAIWAEALRARRVSA